ncbi:MAG: PDGLE domain-containing protein [Dehalococcoidales bacterium]|jgi:hypothetical protein
MKWWHWALIASLLLAVLSPLASSSPDGLEKVAENHGFIEKASAAPYQVIADYVFPGVHNEKLATILAGLLGTLVVFGVAYGVSWLIKRRRTGSAGQ